MKVIENIVYSAEAEERGVGDLILPDELCEHTPLALSIHGGGWGALDKSRMSGIAGFLVEELGFAVFNINYRLVTKTPWPACGNDCLEGAKFLLKGNIPELTGVKRKKIMVIGGSAGGHLALMTGLRISPDKISGIVTISGINSVKNDISFAPGRYKALFGHEPSEEELCSVDPVKFITSQSPPVLCTHDFMDNVVPIQCSREFADAADKAGSRCSCYFYRQNEEGYSHRIFIPGSIKLYRDIEEAIANWIRTTCYPDTV